MSILYNSRHSSKKDVYRDQQPTCLCCLPAAKCPFTDMSIWVLDMKYNQLLCESNLEIMIAPDRNVRTTIKQLQASEKNVSVQDWMSEFQIPDTKCSAFWISTIFTAFPIFDFIINLMTWMKGLFCMIKYMMVCIKWMSKLTSKWEKLSVQSWIWARALISAGVIIW